MDNCLADWKAGCLVDMTVELMALPKVDNLAVMMERLLVVLKDQNLVDLMVVWLVQKWVASKAGSMAAKMAEMWDIPKVDQMADWKEQQ